MESATGHVVYTYTNQFAARCVAVSSSYSREFYPSFQKYFKQMELSNSLGELYVCLHYYHYYYYYYYFERYLIVVNESVKPPKKKKKQLALLRFNINYLPLRP